MGLLRTIPGKTNEQLPFLLEVDFAKLQQQLGRLAFAPARPSPPQRAEDLKDDGLKARFSHLVGIQSGLEQLRMILASSGVSNAWLSGAKGIGKTALVEALIRHRAEGRLTSQLMSKPFFLFDVNGFFTQPREAWVEHFNACLQAVGARDGLIIIDHMDDLVQTADGEAGRLVSTLIKHLEHADGPQAIIITESDRERDVHESSTGMARRFQMLKLYKEPTFDHSRPILIAHLARLEQIHNVDFSEATADEILRLLGRYPGRAFEGVRPDCLIRFADAVATHVRLNKYAEPPEVTEMSERICQLQDRLAILSMDDPGAKERRSAMEHELALVCAQHREADRAWRTKFAPLFDAIAAFERLDTQLTALRAAPRRTPAQDQQFDLLSPAYEAARAAVEAQEKALYPRPPCVEPKHVRLVFSRESGVPLSTLGEDKLKRLAKLAAHLDDEIFLQAKAKAALAKAYREREMGVSDPSRPAGVIMFTGDTGLGKTELVKVLARFDAGEAAEPVILRLSEFTGETAPKKLLGADPGYAGYEAGSPFLDPVDVNSRAIVLLDEADKAHPSVFNVLMQLLEEGKIRNAKGRLIDFKDTILVIATNALKASDLSQDQMTNQEVIRERLKQLVSPETGGPLFRPEFIGRIDEVVVFENLGEAEAIKILKKEIRNINRDYGTRGVRVDLDDDAAARIIRRYYVPAMGGRSPRMITKEHIRPQLTDYLERRLLETGCGDEPLNEDLRVVLQDHHIVLEPAGASRSRPQGSGATISAVAPA